MNTSLYTEEQLLNLMKEKDVNALYYLFDKYAGSINGILGRLFPHSLHEDALKNIFTNVWNNIDKYDPSKGSVFSWMIGITRYSIGGIIEKGSDGQRNIIDLSYGYTKHHVASQLNVPVDKVGKLLYTTLKKLSRTHN